MSLTTSQLTQMRTQLSTRLPDSAIIQAPTYPGDSAGGPGTANYTAVGGGTVACRLDPVDSVAEHIQILSARENLKVVYRLVVPYDAPLAKDCRVLINGDTFEILALADQHSWRVCRRALVGRLEP